MVVIQKQAMEKIEEEETEFAKHLYQWMVEKREQEQYRAKQQQQVLLIGGTD
jgi:hypothetical protein